MCPPFELFPIEVVLATGASDDEFARAFLSIDDAGWLDSSAQGRFGQQSYLVGRGEVVLEWRCEQGVSRYPLLPLRNAFVPYAAGANGANGFFGGLLGYLSYDARHLFESLPARHPRATDLPDLHFRRHWAVLVRDESSGDVSVRRWSIPGRPTLEARSQAEAESLRLAWKRRDHVSPLPAADPLHMMSFSRESHEDRVRRAGPHLERGDIYQVNLAARWTFERPADLRSAYLALRARNPPTFGAYYPAGQDAILSLSPERFFSMSEGTVRTRPVKGTRPRGLTPEADAAAMNDLLQSTKDHAELAMIVDVLRNDLSRVAEVGSVKVTEPLALESHATVHHLVAEIQGQVQPGRTAVDVLAALFPGGSITGAPRIRAMEIIDALEEGRRGPYCGTLGWIGFDGSADFNILIRTAFTAGDKLLLHGGGGVTVLSGVDAEVAEAETKVRAFLDVLAKGE